MQGVHPQVYVNPDAEFSPRELQQITKQFQGSGCISNYSVTDKFERMVQDGIASGGGQTVDYSTEYGVATAAPSMERMAKFVDVSGNNDITGGYSEDALMAILGANIRV
jgi:hypothetical protein